MHSSWNKKALSHGSIFDFSSSALIFVAYSIPGWALGGVLLVIFGGGSFFDVFPLEVLEAPEIWDTLTPIQKVFDQIHHMILPIIAWTITSFATMTVLMKNSLLENLSQDYVRTAFSKGLKEKRVIWLHAMRNSLIPIASGIGHILGVVIAGSYFIERMFISMVLVEWHLKLYFQGSNNTRLSCNRSYNKVTSNLISI